MLNPFLVYSTYMATKLHFKPGNYDAFKFNFKGPKIQRRTFESSRERIYVEKIAKKFKDEESLRDYFLANILAGNDWIGAMSDESYSQWCGRIQSISYSIKSDVKTLADFAKSKGLSFDFCLSQDSSGNVPIINDLIGILSKESIIAIDVCTNFLQNIDDEKLLDPLHIYKEKTYIIRKYKPFIEKRINKKATSAIIIKLFTDDL